MSFPCRDACSARSTDFLQAVDKNTPSSRFSNGEFTRLLKMHSLTYKGGCHSLFSYQAQRWRHIRPAVFTDYRYGLQVTLTWNRKAGHTWPRKKITAPGSGLSSARVFVTPQVYVVVGTYLKLGTQIAVTYNLIRRCYYARPVPKA
jgi:hypothetical protein